MAKCSTLCSPFKSLESSVLYQVSSATFVINEFGLVCPFRYDFIFNSHPGHLSPGIRVLICFHHLPSHNKQYAECLFVLISKNTKCFRSIRNRAIPLPRVLLSTSSPYSILYAHITHVVGRGETDSVVAPPMACHVGSISCKLSFPPCFLSLVM